MKLTNWFVNGEKPVHKGVYNVSCQTQEQSGDWYSYWNGHRFGYFSTNAEDAYDERFEKTTAVVESWRGILRD